MSVSEWVFGFRFRFEVCEGAEARAAREAAESDVRSAVTDVTSKVLELAIGRAPTEQVESAVADVMNSEVRS